MYSTSLYKFIYPLIQEIYFFCPFPSPLNHCNPPHQFQTPGKSSWFYWSTWPGDKWGYFMNMASFHWLEPVCPCYEPSNQISGSTFGKKKIWSSCPVLIKIKYYYVCMCCILLVLYRVMIGVWLCCNVIIKSFVLTEVVLIPFSELFLFYRNKWAKDANTSIRIWGNVKD